MNRLLAEGSLHRYRLNTLTESRGAIPRDIPETTIFISHSHDDLDNLKDVLGFLEQYYHVKTYIDSEDPTMPRVISRETARRLKTRIRQCNKFILLATHRAINSKWCNWELGFGDADKFKAKNIALFPLLPQWVNDGQYKGAEYLSLYPYIAYEDGTHFRRDGTRIDKGFYVITETDEGRRRQPLKDWLKK